MIKISLVITRTLFILGILTVNSLQASQQSPEELITQAVEQLSAANIANEQSRQLIIEANDIRKNLIKLRAPKSPDNSTKVSPAEIDQQAAQLVKQLENNQSNGAKLRAQSEQLKQQSANNFENGFVTIWKKWVTNRQPLTMDSLVESYFAHNAKIRSVHKNMLNQMGSVSELSQANDNDDAANNTATMSLQIPALVQQNAPPDLNISAFKFSRKEQYFAHIEVHNTKENAVNTTQQLPSNVSAVPLNKIHQWRVLVSDLQGKPVEKATILVEGHMPGHVHGLPTEPRIVDEIAPGVYILDGVKFQMKGWWVIKLIFQSPAEIASNKTDLDFITFNLVL